MSSLVMTATRREIRLSAHPEQPRIAHLPFLRPIPFSGVPSATKHGIQRSEEVTASALTMIDSTTPGSLYLPPTKLRGHGRPPPHSGGELVARRRGHQARV